MLYTLNFSKKDLLPFCLIFLMVFSRLIPHPPNFTPIIAVAIMSGYFFSNFYFSLLVLLISMTFSDLFFGFYNNMIFVYFALILINYVFFKIKSIINFKNLFFISIIASSIFFIISNFGVWFFGPLYEKNLNGLILCYYMAIPFFTKTLTSTIIFSYTAYSLNYLLKRKIA